MRQLIVDIKWLYAMWIAKRFLRSRELPSSQRAVFYQTLHCGITSALFWPDAMIAITPERVRLAVATAKSCLGPAPRPNPQDDPDG